MTMSTRRGIDENLPVIPKFAFPPLDSLLPDLETPGDELPAGGPIAAVTAGLAAALVAGAADSSRAVWDEAGAARAQGHALAARALRLAERDAAGVQAARGALAARGTNPATPAATRDWRLGEAIRQAAAPAQALAATAADIAELAGEVAAHGAPEVRPDAAVAAALAAGAARAAATLVRANLVVGGEHPEATRADARANRAERAAASATETGV
jgi:methenyltetrahydrofolate cyclohydrolase